MSTQNQHGQNVGLFALIVLIGVSKIFVNMALDTPIFIGSMDKKMPMLAFMAVTGVVSKRIMYDRPAGPGEGGTIRFGGCDAVRGRLARDAARR